MKKQIMDKIQLENKPNDGIKVHPSKASRIAAKTTNLAEPKSTQLGILPLEKTNKIVEPNVKNEQILIQENVNRTPATSVQNIDPGIAKSDETQPEIDLRSESIIANQKLSDILSSVEHEQKSVVQPISNVIEQTTAEAKPYGPYLKLPFVEPEKRVETPDHSIPMAQLEKYGLAKDGQVLLKSEDFNALMNGLRTSMIEILNLTNESGETIDKINVKVSLAEDNLGDVEVLFHPIYPEPRYPDFLSADEAAKLEQGDTYSITKNIIEDGVEKLMIVEFDHETKEFVKTDPSQIQVPDMMNSEYLSEEQKEKYRRGKAVELSDGTRFRFSATDPLGIRADKILLIASILIDGGLSYILYSGIKAIANGGKQSSIAEARTEGYEQALKDYNIQQTEKQKQEQSRSIEHSGKNEQNRGREKSRMTSR